MTATHIAGYKHVRGVHCATAALRNVVYHAKGLLLSEAMVLGIGSGLNFSYVRFPWSPVIVTMGRGTDIEVTFSDALGISLEACVFYDPVPAWQYLKERIEAQQLVMIDTDMFMLPYCVAEMEPAMLGFHFGGHKTLVVGFNLTEDCAFLADYAWQKPHRISLPALAQARNTGDCPSPPQNRTFVFHFPETLFTLQHAIMLGLTRNACLMRNPISSCTGLPAIDRFCRQVRHWNHVLPENDLLANVALAGYMMEKGGSGGGNFRNLYARFLSESSAILKDVRLQQAAGIYLEAGRLWTELAGLLTESAHGISRGLFDPARQGDRLLKNIWKLENEGLCAIEGIVQYPEAETSSFPADKN